MAVGQDPTSDRLELSRHYSPNSLGPHMQNHSLKVDGLYEKQTRILKWAGARLDLSSDF